MAILAKMLIEPLCTL